MKYKAVLSPKLPGPIVALMNSQKFANFMLKEVSSELGVSNPHQNPAGYYVQAPDTLLSGAKHDDLHGIEMRLTGVSRSGRTPEQILSAHNLLTTILQNHIALALKEFGNDHITIQLFVVMMMDADVHLGEGKYGSVIESKLISVDCKTEIRNTFSED